MPCPNDLAEERVHSLAEEQDCYGPQYCPSHGAVVPQQKMSCSCFRLAYECVCGGMMTSTTALLGGGELENSGNGALVTVTINKFALPIQDIKTKAELNFSGKGLATKDAIVIAALVPLNVSRRKRFN